MGFVKKLINKLSTGGHGQDAVTGVARECEEGGGQTVGENFTGVKLVARANGGGILNAVKAVTDGVAAGSGNHGVGLQVGWVDESDYIKCLADCQWENLAL